MSGDDLHSQNEEYRRGIKLRLRLARIRAGFATLAGAAREVDRLMPISARAYTDYENGPNMPGIAQIQQLERLFKVPHGWIAVGDGKTIAELEAILAEVQKAIGRKAKRKDEQAAEKQTVNQLTANILQLDIKSSQSVPSGRIPVLLVDEIALFLAGDAEFTIAPERMLTVPDFILAGPKVFCYVLPENDFSMTGALPAFRPGDHLVFDGARDATHNDYLLIQRKGALDWLFRRYEGGAPLSMAEEFLLRALNPAVSPIHVTERDAWTFGGRLIWRLEAY